MNYYLKEVTRIKEERYSNERQLETVIETRRYINNHFNKDLNLDLLSNLRYTSKFHLLRLFKQYYGQTPRQYLIEKRIEQAKKLLLEGKSMTDTCFEIGYESPSAFSTLFKSRVGLSPTAFQKRAIFTKSD